MAAAFDGGLFLYYIKLSRFFYIIFYILPNFFSIFYIFFYILQISCYIVQWNTALGQWQYERLMRKSEISCCLNANNNVKSNRNLTWGSAPQPKGFYDGRVALAEAVLRGSGKKQ